MCLYIANVRTGPIDFNAVDPPFTVRSTPTGVAVSFDDNGWGGALASGDDFIGQVTLSGIKLHKNTLINNTHLRLRFERDEVVYVIPIDVHFHG